MYGLGNLGNKVTAFTARVVDVTAYLKRRKAVTIADQFFRSGTSIGANCSEAVYAASKADYLNKLTIALKEANETQHWIEVMNLSNLLEEDTFQSLKTDCIEICKIISTIVHNIKINIEQEKQQQTRRNI